MRLRALVVAALCVCAGPVQAEPRVQLIMNPQQLSPALQARLLQRLASRRGGTQAPKPLERSVTLWELVRKNYGYTASRDKKGASADTLVDLIRRDNGLTAKTLRLDAGRMVALPAVPPRPAPQAQRDTVLLLDPDGGPGAVASLDACRFTADQSPSLGSCIDPQLKPDQARLWGLSADSPDALRDQLGPELYRMLLSQSDQGEPLRFVEVHPYSSVTSSPAGGAPPREDAGPPAPWGPTIGTLSTAQRQWLAQLRPQTKLYVVDYFAEASCEHGNQVLGVVTAILRAAGVPEDQARQLVAKEELRRTWDDLMEKRVSRALAKSHNRDDLPKLLSQLKEAASKWPHALPALYLQALFADDLDDQNSVLTTSFFIEDRDINLLPEPPKGALLCAVPDDPGQIDQVRTQPQKGCLENSNRGVVLVGAYDQAGATTGTVSKRQALQADWVTMVAPGGGYGLQCEQASRAQTSFATPAVATELFLARAYWSELLGPSKIDSIAAKRRLIQASQVLSGLVGSYASAGPPRLDWLLQGRGAVLLPRQGSTVPVRVTGQVRWRQDDEQVALTVSEKGGKLLGLQWAAGRAYALRDGSASQLAWSPVDKLELGGLSVRTEDQRTITEEELRDQHQGVLFFFDKP